jgi:hypothetical protein
MAISPQGSSNLDKNDSNKQPKVSPTYLSLIEPNPMCALPGNKKTQKLMAVQKFVLGGLSLTRHAPHAQTKGNKSCQRRPASSSSCIERVISICIAEDDEGEMRHPFFRGHYCLDNGQGSGMDTFP